MLGFQEHCENLKRPDFHFVPFPEPVRSRALHGSTLSCSVYHATCLVQVKGYQGPSQTQGAKRQSGLLEGLGIISQPSAAFRMNISPLQPSGRWDYHPSVQAKLCGDVGECEGVAVLRVWE